jgi:pyruvate/2-oxoglutarate dehydrogenase complex dihydrolipoamide acyltransferase (E2) component
MPHEFRMPDIGEGLTEAEIVAWLVEEGEVVAVGQAIVEVETAKTTVEIPAPQAGTILRLVGDAGDTVVVGEVLFVIGSRGEDTGAPPGGGEDELQRNDGSQAEGSRSSKPHSRGVQAMPVVRKLASDLGVDLTSVTGSGPGGAITRADVELAASEETSGSDRRETLSGVRRAIASHLTESWRTIPHVTVQAEVRAEALLSGRATTQGTKLPVEAVIALAVIPLLRSHPEFNATVDGEDVIYRSHINLGFAVDTSKGLKVVVVRNADAKTPPELAEAFERMAHGAIAGSATPDELTGQTFTISNIGALGGGHGTPIIPLGTTAILSMGRAVPQPVVVDGELSIGLVAPLDLSYDHRLIDGGLGQRFLADLVHALERE